MIIGMVRRGGGSPQKAMWTGTAWSKTKAHIYPTQAQAKVALARINIRLVDSFMIAPVEAKRPVASWGVER